MEFLQNKIDTYVLRNNSQMFSTDGESTSIQISSTEFLFRDYLSTKFFFECVPREM